MRGYHLLNGAYASAATGRTPAARIFAWRPDITGVVGIYSQPFATISPKPARPVMLDEARERRLFLRHRRFGDRSARAQLIERYLPLARHLAQRYQRPHEPIDDLVQVASVGLVKAVDRFDPTRGAAFSTFAVPTILGELKRYFRDCGWAVRVPRGTQERMLTVNAVTARLSRRLGRSPTTAEVVGASGLSAEQVSEAMEAAVAARPTSLELELDGDDCATWARSLGAEDDGFELVDDRDAVERGLVALSDRDRLVLRLRFVDGLTQSQIATCVGVSQMQVSRVLKRALDDIRAHAEGPSASTASVAEHPLKLAAAAAV